MQHSLTFVTDENKHNIQQVVQVKFIFRSRTTKLFLAACFDILKIADLASVEYAVSPIT